MDSVKVALTVTVSPDLAGRVSELAKDEASRAYVRVAVGVVLSMVKPVWPVAVRVFPAVSTVPTDAVTVPFPAGIVKVPV